MEEHLSTLAATHLLQHTLRSLCSSQWVYAVFWRILPRNYPPPIWENGHPSLDGSRGNKRNWILAWEDGFCNFAPPVCPGSSSSRIYGLQPELFFKMSHEIYNYGEGLLGKVAADKSHKWVFNDPQYNDSSFQAPCNNNETFPRTWEAQFQSGIKTIALVAVREGVVQLGAVDWISEDLNYVVSLRKKMGCIECIPGVLLPHPLTYSQVVPSMRSLDALLSKLPPVSMPPQHYSAVFNPSQKRR